eukprot:TRINITY_DN16484_c0_g1_i1.p1 TRINITY_DN16484_c0_g1~~TRINITY_DN16484_c0_g1_i1.p1  ORF type:complete len:124 (+),score=13.67 TRINITY_DN16484_c0_g1_i1:358-729(+)
MGSTANDDYGSFCNEAAKVSSFGLTLLNVSSASLTSSGHVQCSDLCFEDCETPKSDEHKISSVSVCPPAPRKPKPKSSILCKRRSAGAAVRDRGFFVPPAEELALLFDAEDKVKNQAMKRVHA